MENRVIRIAAVVSQVSGFGQTLLSGCARWLGEHPRAGVWITKGDLRDPRLDLAAFDGVIYHGGDPGFARRLARFGGPAINTSANTRTIPSNSVLSDDHAAARLAIEHFMERGRRDVAVVAVGRTRHYARREAAFVETARAMKLAPLVLRLPRWNTTLRACGILDQVRHHAGSLGLYATDNPLGTRLCADLTEAGIAIPDQVAVVGVGNETNLCEFATPPLSSVDNAIDLRGYRAIDELLRQIAGKPALTRPIVIQPRGILIRHSSDLFAVRDPEVRQAMRYIHDHAEEAIAIADVVRFVNVSRRALEQRFRLHLGRTLHQEVWRAHLQLARQLLIETDLPMYHVAVRSGFGTLSNFSTLFRRAHGVPPGEFRRRHRAGG